MKLKIALIYSGYLRTWDLCKANHEQNIYTPETDLWFYTYEDPGLNRPHNWTKIQQPFYDDPFAPHRFDKNRSPEGNVYNSFNQWHNNLIAFSLVARKYDVYVRIRPDIKFNGPLNFGDHQYGDNLIHIPDGHDYRGINDQFAFGNYDVMRKYFSVYLNCYDLFEQGTMFNTEVMQKANLLKEDVRVNRIGYPQHDLIR